MLKSLHFGLPVVGESCRFAFADRILGIFIDNRLFSAFRIHDREPLVGKAKFFISIVARAIGSRDRMSRRSLISVSGCQEHLLERFSVYNISSTVSRSEMKLPDSDSGNGLSPNKDSGQV